MKSTVTDLNGRLMSLRSRVLLAAFAAAISIGAPMAAAQTTFTGFTPGTVNYQAQGGCTTVTTPLGYVIPSQYGSCWTAADEWGFQMPAPAFDELVVDDGTGNMVWRFSNAVTSTSFSFLPNSPSSPAVAGESGAFLWNDRGPNHTTPVTGTRAPATTRYFHGSFRVKSATGAAQAGLALNISPTARQSDRRNSWVGLVDTGSGLDVTFYETGIGGTFAPSATVIATGLSYTAWHKIDIYVEFMDGLNGDGSGNDIVTVLVNDAQAHVGTTWETYYRVFTSTRPVGAVDALFFRSSGTAAPGTLGNGFFFDDVVVDNANFVPEPVCTTTCYVDAALGNDTFGGASPDRAKKTIQAGVMAVSEGGTVIVAAGTYVENPTVAKSLFLLGPQAGNSVDGRTALDLSEANLTGKLTLNAPDVIVDGFSITNPGQGFGIVVKKEGSGAKVRNNFVSNVGPSTSGTPVVAVYLEHGPDEVEVRGNVIFAVRALGASAQGILVGDTSTNGDCAAGANVSFNNISLVSSFGTVGGPELLPSGKIGLPPGHMRGAYGIQVNRCTTGLVVENNRIEDLDGWWVHGIGLEGNTPNSTVRLNTISDLSGANPASLDVVGVHIEANPGYPTIHINQNNLDGMVFGVAFHPSMLFKLNADLSFTYFTPSVDATCNWFGDEDGPNVWEFTSKPEAYPALPTGAFTDSPGEGVGVNPGVIFNPWSTAPNPSACLPLSQLDKQSVRDDLAALLGTLDKKDDKEVEKAVEHLDKALEAGNWIDASHPARKKVFDEERQAVERLSKVKDTDVSSFIARLVDIDRAMAMIAIDEATAVCAIEKCQKELEHALDRLDKGDYELGKGKPEKAINEYGEAWKHAVKAADKAAGKGLDEEILGEQPEAIALEQNYPNPFNPSTSINFEVPGGGAAKLVVYDVLGRQVRVLVDATLDSGWHQVTFDARDLPSGTYIYRLTTPAGTRSKVMLLMK